MPLQDPLFGDLTPYMQRLQDCVSKGYQRYTSGELRAEKWNSFKRSMFRKYELGISASSRSKRRKSGEAMGRLYGFQKAPEVPVKWFLMVSDGEGRLPNYETLQSVKNKEKRISVEGYELVHDGKTWSWRMTTATVEWWKESFDKVAKHRPQRRRIAQNAKGQSYDIDAEALMDALYASPGFRLVRRQVGNIAAHAVKSWNRFRPINGPRLHARPFLHYVRRMKNS